MTEITSEEVTAAYTSTLDHLPVGPTANRIYYYPASRAHHAVCMMIDHGIKFEKANGSLWDMEGLMNIRFASQYKIKVARESIPALLDGTMNNNPWHQPEITIMEENND